MQMLSLPVAGSAVMPIAKGVATDKQFLEKEIGQWHNSEERKRQIEGETYYNGYQKISNRKRTTIGENGSLQTVPHLPNNKILDNQYAKMIDQKTNYLLGRQFSFDTDNKAYDKALGEVFAQRARRLLRIVAESCYISGLSWIYPYYDQTGVLSFTRFPAYEVLPFWADQEHTILDCAVRVYDITRYNQNTSKPETVHKVEVFHGGGVDRFEWRDGRLAADPDAPPGGHATVVIEGRAIPYNWERIPLICFKANHREKPLLNRVKCLQDALNLMLSNYVNNMEEDVRNTVLVIRNYDGEDLGEFRRNLATYGAVKVRSYDGCEGAVETLEIQLNAENYKAIIDILKKAIIENARGFDAKDDRLTGNPNQLNIRSMYSDIDLDANELELEFQSAFEDLLWFVNQYLAQTGKGDFNGVEVNVIFDRDILINETEAIENCVKSTGILSKKTIVAQHPWISDPKKELERIEKEEEDAINADPYRAAFNAAGEPNGDT